MWLVLPHVDVYGPPPFETELCLRRGARVADWGGLENRCPCKRTVGSNPPSPPLPSYNLDFTVYVDLSSVFAARLVHMGGTHGDEDGETLEACRVVEVPF